MSLNQAAFGGLVGPGVHRATVGAWEAGGEISLVNVRRLIELGLDPVYVLPTASGATDARADLSSRGAA
jgi:hypothetical protein